tara:strand:- start:241 stop:480 length:240 start_codon:yes stop_codon:yes gene_type:complete
MSKESKVMTKEVDTKEVVKNTNNVAEPIDKAQEAIETLKVQLQEHSRLSEQHRTMATKAQGALEVLLQLHPQKEENSDS